MKQFPQNRLLPTVVAIASAVVLVTPAVCQQPPSFPSSRPAASSQGELFKAKFQNTTLEMVMEEYAGMVGKTPLIQPGASINNLTLTSDIDLTKDEYILAIESILSMHGIALVPFGEKFVKVVKSEQARTFGMDTQMDTDDMKLADSDRLVSQVIVLKNMDVGEAQKVVDGFKSGNARILPLERINGLLITESSINIKRIVEMLTELDQPVVTREKLFVHPVLYAKPSEIKAKLEEIIKDLQDKPEGTTPTVARPRSSGPPGIIRAQPEMPVTTVAGTDATGADAEKGIVRGKVKIIADDRTGILLFITAESNMQFFEDIIKALDLETAPDVLVQVFRLEFADAEAVAGMLNSLIGAQASKDSTTTPTPSATTPEGTAKGVALDEYVRASRKESEGVAGKSKVGELSAQNIKILSDKRTNSLIIMASKNDLAMIQEIIKDMDMMLSQVLIEAVIIEIDLSDTLKTGIDWVQKSLIAYDVDASGRRKPIGAFSGKGGGGSLNPVDATTVNAYPAGGGISYYFTHYGLNVDAVIQAAANDSRTRVISAPVILTTDNTEAKISATKQIYVFSGNIINANSSVTTANYETKDIGLELTVKPHINKNKVVMMEITQTMSEPGEEGSPQSGMTISSRRAVNASIAVADRETVILGGQVRRDVTQSRDQIPLLGDLPLLGRLFNSSSDTSKRSEMIIFITPYVLDTPDEISAESRRRKRSMDIDKMWQKGWSDSKLAEPTWQQKRDEKKSKRTEERARRDAEEDARDKAEAEAEAAEEAAKEAGKTKPSKPSPYAVVGTPASTESASDAANRIKAMSDKWQENLNRVDLTTPIGDTETEALPLEEPRP